MSCGRDPEVRRVLAKCHDVRNLGEYEGDPNVDERLVAATRRNGMQPLVPRIQNSEAAVRYALRLSRPEKPSGFPILTSVRDKQLEKGS
jgi:hypothetical protein